MRTEDEPTEADLEAAQADEVLDLDELDVDELDAEPEDPEEIAP